MVSYRTPSDDDQGFQIRSLILGDHAGLPGAAAVVLLLNPLLLSFIRRRMGRKRPCEYHFTPEAIARMTWRKAFFEVGPAFWEAIDEQDALTKFYGRLANLAAESLDGHRDRIFGRVARDHGKLVRDIAIGSCRKLGVPWREREDVEQECWKRIGDEIPLSDIITTSEVEAFVRQKANSAAIDYARKVGRRRLPIEPGLPDIEDSCRSGISSTYEARELLSRIIGASQGPPHRGAVIELLLLDYDQREIAEALDLSMRQVRRVRDNLVETGRQLHAIGN